MGSRFRVLGLLVIMGVTLFALKPFGKAWFAELQGTTDPVSVKKPQVHLQRPVPEVNLEVISTVFDGVPVRIYKPNFNASKKSLMPAVVFFHGGGWIQGSLDISDSYTRKVAKNTGLVVISVGYRLAPEHPFPIPLNDCHNATLYIHKHASELGVDASKVILMGHSAGGNLAAAVSQRMKDMKPPLLAQILTNPVMQSLNLRLPSHEAYRRDWVAPMFVSYFTGTSDTSLINAMTRGSHVSDRVHQLYSEYVDYLKLPESYRKDYVAPHAIQPDPTAAKKLEPFITNPEINPLMSKDLKNLPRTMVVTAGRDCLRDDGMLYVIRLEEAGVPVRHFNYEDGMHTDCIDVRNRGPDSVASRMNSDIVNFIHSRISGKQNPFR